MYFGFRHFFVRACRPTQKEFLLFLDAKKQQFLSPLNLQESYRINVCRTMILSDKHLSFHILQNKFTLQESSKILQNCHPVSPNDVLHKFGVVFKRTCFLEEIVWN